MNLEYYTLKKGDVILHYEAKSFWAVFYDHRGEKRIDRIFFDC